MPLLSVVSVLATWPTLLFLPPVVVLSFGQRHKQDILN